MSTRKIVWTSTAAPGQNTVFSAATTWGQLKSEDAELGARSIGMKAFVKETSTSLTSDSQSLPEGDFTLYFLVEKNDSGKND